MTLGSLSSGVGLALATIREHKLRSFLTVLGVIIGTGAVIGVGSIITGLDRAITGMLRSFGPDTLIVLKARAMSDWTPEEMRRKPLTLENARAIQERCASVEHVSPYLFPSWNQIHKARYKGNDIYQIDIAGTEESYAAGGTVMLAGRFFTDTESRHRMPVVVIGEAIGKGWFAHVDPIGKWVEVDGHALQVVGVMQTPAASFPGDEDKRFLIPYFTMRKLFPNARRAYARYRRQTRIALHSRGRSARYSAHRAPRASHAAGYFRDFERGADDRGLPSCDLHGCPGDGDP